MEIISAAIPNPIFFWLFWTFIGLVVIGISCADTVLRDALSNLPLVSYLTIMTVLGPVGWLLILLSAVTSL